MGLASPRENRRARKRGKKDDESRKATEPREAARREREAAGITMSFIWGEIEPRLCGRLPKQEPARSCKNWPWWAWWWQGERAWAAKRSGHQQNPGHPNPSTAEVPAPTALKGACYWSLLGRGTRHGPGQGGLGEQSRACCLAVCSAGALNHGVGKVGLAQLWISAFGAPLFLMPLWPLALLWRFSCRPAAGSIHPYLNSLRGCNHFNNQRASAQHAPEEGRKCSIQPPPAVVPGHLPMVLFVFAIARRNCPLSLLLSSCCAQESRHQTIILQYNRNATCGCRHRISPPSRLSLYLIG
jgi:hypothetical protein